MNPEVKSKLTKLIIGALVAGAVAALTYFTSGLSSLFPSLPLSVFAGVGWAVAFV